MMMIDLPVLVCLSARCSWLTFIGISFKCCFTSVLSLNPVQISWFCLCSSWLKKLFSLIFTSSSWFVCNIVFWINPQPWHYLVWKLLFSTLPHLILVQASSAATSPAWTFYSIRLLQFQTHRPAWCLWLPPSLSFQHLCLSDSYYRHCTMYCSLQHVTAVGIVSSADLSSVSINHQQGKQ